MIGKKFKKFPTLKIQQNLLNLQKTTIVNDCQHGCLELNKRFNKTCSIYKRLQSLMIANMVAWNWTKDLTKLAQFTKDYNH